MIPVPGWTGDYEWTGYIPFAELPYAFNPESHFIVTANNKVVSEDYPHFISSEWLNGYRARRITDLIQAKDKLTAGDFSLIQGDCYSLPCAQVAKHLLALAPQDHRQEEALRYVAGWDGYLAKESVGGTICQVFLWCLQAKVFGHKLPGLYADYLGAGFHPAVPTNAFFGRSTPILLDLLDKRDDAWFGDAQHTGADGASPPWWQDFLEESLAETLAYLRRELGENVSSWRWGRLHQVSFAHIFANFKPLHVLFSRGPFPIGGDTDTVCQSGYLPHEPFRARSIASDRQIIDLGDLRQSVMIHAPGQSGHPASRNYDNLIAPWRAVQFHPMLFDRDDVLANVRHILHLQPT